ncbi:MAG TPA: glycosyltransferase family 2 protein [Tepidisphaeraceae bacterium]|jgi:glycosyltransferase involved in cell wall biosynthesis|nr:glycosyltransferase family 2 protein [Tepidisphaeraceae bacterium]
MTAAATQSTTTTTPAEATRPDGAANDAPLVTILVPCMNEELVVGEFVDWCWQGLRDAGVTGEVVLIDSSSDRSPEIAEARGARICSVPKRGLGRAYIDGLSAVRGKYVIVGDCDLTYDFREIGPFIQKLNEGYDFVMGTRMKGRIDEGAMPKMHRYFGTPVTTWMLNRIYKTPFSDIHCGMRGLTLDAFKRLDLQSQSWQYASEMIIKSVHMGFRNTEVPIHFLKDREGRVSHLKRGGYFTFLAPWYAGWITLQAMFTFGADYFLFKPGIILLALGLLLTLPLSFGPLTVGGIGLSLHWMLLGLTISLLGLQMVLMGIVAKVLYDYQGHVTNWWLRLFNYNRAMIVAMALFVVGVACAMPLVWLYVSSGLALPPELGWQNYLLVTGLLAVVASFLVFSFTLLLHATDSIKKRRGGV